MGNNSGQPLSPRSQAAVSQGASQADIIAEVIRQLKHCKDAAESGKNKLAIEAANDNLGTAQKLEFLSRPELLKRLEQAEHEAMNNESKFRARKRKKFRPPQECHKLAKDCYHEAQRALHRLGVTVSVKTKLELLLSCDGNMAGNLTYKRKTMVGYTCDEKTASSLHKEVSMKATASVNGLISQMVDLNLEVGGNLKHDLLTSCHIKNETATETALGLEKMDMNTQFYCYQLVHHVSTASGMPFEVKGGFFFRPTPIPTKLLQIMNK